MKKNLGVIIAKKDYVEGTIYCTENCDYLVLEEGGKLVVEGKINDPKKLEKLDFVTENDDSFLLGYFNNEKEMFEGIIEFEKNQWG